MIFVYVIDFCVGLSETPKQKVESMLTRIRPTGPGGCGRGYGRGRGWLPSHHITSPETIKFVKEAEERSEKKDKIKEEKKVFCKKALLQKAKRDRLFKKLKLEGEL